MNFILFDKVSLYDDEKNETIIYGQYKEKIQKICIEGLEHEVIFCNCRPDFYIKILGKISYLENIFFYLDNEIKILKNVFLLFPFENCDIKLNKDTSAIISTLCKNYSHRLDEWIQYNLHLGFSGIIIFNNDFNTSNNLNESLENCIIYDSIETISKKYKGKVWIVDYPYSPLENEHWNTIQRITLHIGVNEFRKKCRNIALIDADEFIYIHKNPLMKIETFLQEQISTITMKSNILTNKKNDDILNNNILNIAEYVGEDKFTKTILQTDNINYLEFIVTPHDHPTEQILNKNDIIHYHCWVNNRYHYNESMVKIDFLKPF